MLTPFGYLALRFPLYLWYNKTRFLRGSLLVVDRPRRARARARAGYSFVVPLKKGARHEIISARTLVIINGPANV